MTATKAAKTVPWVRIDGTIHNDRKFLLLGADKLTCVGLFVAMIGYSRVEGTDGALTDPEIVALAGGSIPADEVLRLADRMTEVGLLTRDGVTRYVTRYSAHQQTGLDIETVREQAAERQRRRRERIKTGQDTPDHVTSNVTSNVTSRVSHAPVTRLEKREKKTETPNGVSEDAPLRDAPGSRPDVDEACGYLASSIQAKTGIKQNVTKTWRREMRTLIDQQNYTPDQVKALIDTACADTFLIGVCSTPTGLRRNLVKVQTAWRNGLRAPDAAQNGQGGTSGHPARFSGSQRPTRGGMVAPLDWDADTDVTSEAGVA